MLIIFRDMLKSNNISHIYTLLKTDAGYRFAVRIAYFILTGYGNTEKSISSGMQTEKQPFLEITKCTEKVVLSVVY